MGIEFKKSQRTKVKLRLALTGPAGSGKTLGALYLAKGIAGSWDNVCVIDTENGRSLLYSNRSDLNTGEFYQANLEAPYTVEKYIEYMESAAELVGANGVVIVDSLSHAWSGTGGVLDFKEKVAQQRGQNDFSSWRVAGQEQNKLIDALMQLDCHVIATMRAKTSYAIEQDAETGKTRVKKLGLEADQRGTTEYEFTTVFQLDKDGNMAELSKDNTILQAEGFYGKLTPEIGERLRAWSSEGVEPVVYTCECCGKKIKSYVFEDGMSMSPQEIVEKSKETYGKAMCMNCCLQALEEMDNEEENVEETEE